MTRVALKGLLGRKTRAILTAVAIVIGVAMISGTYILTDTIKAAFSTVFTRALITRPTILFADEPTGNLDSKTGGEILDLLKSSVEEYGQTIVMVTHEPRAAAFADSVRFLADGQIVTKLEEATASDVLEVMSTLQT